MLTYEYPLNERVRTLLRLEDMFARTGYFLRANEQYAHHAALLGLFEILEIGRRADIKFDLLQELERQRQILLGYKHNPNISVDALGGALYEIEQATASLQSMTGKVGQYLRDNEWLMSIKNRTSIPGGLCEFDLPSFHFWLNQDLDSRKNDLESWLAPILPLREGSAIVLRLLRSSGQAEKHTAVRGNYQTMMTGKSTQMLRLQVDSSQMAIPEMSANKYMTNIRFTEPTHDGRARAVDHDVNFVLTFCNL